MDGEDDDREAVVASVDGDAGTDEGGAPPAVPLSDAATGAANADAALKSLLPSPKPGMDDDVNSITGGGGTGAGSHSRCKKPPRKGWGASQQRPLAPPPPIPPDSSASGLADTVTLMRVTSPKRTVGGSTTRTCALALHDHSPQGLAGGGVIIEGGRGGREDWGVTESRRKRKGWEC